MLLCCYVAVLSCCRAVVLQCCLLCCHYCRHVGSAQPPPSCRSRLSSPPRRLQESHHGQLDTTNAPSGPHHCRDGHDWSHPPGIFLASICSLTMTWLSLLAGCSSELHVLWSHVRLPSVPDVTFYENLGKCTTYSICCVRYFHILLIGNLILALNL
jgi:hypothetical protein